MNILGRSVLALAVCAAVGCNTSKNIGNLLNGAGVTPTSPTPAATSTLTTAGVAPSLAAEINSTFKAAMSNGVGAQGVFFAECSRGGNINIANLASAGGRAQLQSTTVNVSDCKHSLNGRDISASGSFGATGAWSIDNPNAPVRLSGNLNVQGLGSIVIDGTTGANFGGTLGGIAVGTPVATPNPPTTPGPTTPVNLQGTWVIAGQPGTLVINQSGSNLTCTVTGLPAGSTQTGCNGTVSGNAVNITQITRAVVTAGAYSTTCDSNQSFAGSATSTAMSGTVTRTGSCTIAGPAPLPAAPTVPTVTAPVVFTKQ